MPTSSLRDPLNSHRFVPAGQAITTATGWVILAVVLAFLPLGESSHTLLLAIASPPLTPCLGRLAMLAASFRQPHLLR
jgi:hypothetical protein